MKHIFRKPTMPHWAEFLTLLATIYCSDRLYSLTIADRFTTWNQWVRPLPFTLASIALWLLIRRNRRTGEFAFYRCFSPRTVPLAALVRVAGRRWTVAWIPATGEQPRSSAMATARDTRQAGKFGSPK